MAIPHQQFGTSTASNTLSSVAALVGSFVALAAGVNDIWEFSSKLLNPIGFAIAGGLIVVGLWTARANQNAATIIASAFIALACYGVLAASLGWPVLPLLSRQADGEAKIVRPVDNAAITGCHLTVSFEGGPKAGSAIVVATREKAPAGKDQAQSFYFEAAERPGSDGNNDIVISIGKQKIDRDVSFDIFLYAVDKSWVDYLRTSRQDAGADNSWWYSVGPPPHGKQLATRNVVRKKGIDKTC